eukprot:9723158-Alexandrium_andersonii.AAC.1
MSASLVGSEMCIRDSAFHWVGKVKDHTQSGVLLGSTNEHAKWLNDKADHYANIRRKAHMVQESQRKD